MQETMLKCGKNSLPMQKIVRRLLQSDENFYTINYTRMRSISHPDNRRVFSDEMEKRERIRS